jgi:hypothetical protein
VSSLSRKRTESGGLVFLIALPLLWLRFGHWFYLSLDEGILLEGARRVAGGQVPYRDFFNITGPGSFWLYGAVFWVFGMSFAAARAVLCVELAAMCGIVCWLVGRFAGTLLSFASALLFLTMLLTTMYPVYVTHRWDSNVFALAALAAATQGGRRWLLVAGVLAGIAAWITPPVVLVGLAICLCAGKERRWFAVGVVIPTVAALALLAAQGGLAGMVQALVWDAASYGAANRLGYGALAGSWETFRRQGCFLASVVHYADSMLPVLLPLLAAMAALIVKARTKIPPAFALLSAACIAALAACLPRLGAAQLLFVAAFFWILFWSAAGSILSFRAQTWVACCLLVLAPLAWVFGWTHRDLRGIDTPAGRLAVSRLHFVTLNDLLSVVRPGESVFVYPYLPALYFVAGVNNPTRYAWLQPGMMGAREVATAIQDLRARPPRWIVWHDFTDAFVLKNWPSSDRARLRFPAMESFLETNYHVVNPDGVVPTGFRLMEKNP